MKLNHKIARLEVQNANALNALAEEERKKKEEETLEARNKEAEARQWVMLQHYIEGECGTCSDEAKVMLKRVLKHVSKYGEPDIEKMSTEERAFWYMLDEVFYCIESEWLLDNEIDYQLEELLGEEGAQKLRSETGMDDRIRILDDHLGPSWRAVQYDYPPCDKLDVEPAVLERFLRGREALKEVAEGNWTGS